MSGLGKQLKKLREAQSKNKNLLKSFANPSVSVGKTVWPKGETEQAKVGFRWDRDVQVTLNNGQVANRFKLQANAQANARSIQDYINRQGSKGTHATIARVDIPVGADDEKVKELIEDTIDGVD